LVDDSHGAGTLGRTGRGTAEYLGVPTERLIQTITLSKAFGVYGGAILGSAGICEKVVQRSRLFVGNTPLPPPLAAGALTALEIVRTNSKMRRCLWFNAEYVKFAMREAGLAVNGGPGPIVPWHTRHRNETAMLRRRLLAAGIHPPFINYLGGPRNGFFRFVISSEHTEAQLCDL